MPCGALCPVFLTIEEQTALQLKHGKISSSNALRLECAICCEHKRQKRGVPYQPLARVTACTSWRVVARELNRHRKPLLRFRIEGRSRDEPR